MRIEQRLQLIAREGVPNYFGDQRFGRNGSTLAQARQLDAGRAVGGSPATAAASTCRHLRG